MMRKFLARFKPNTGVQLRDEATPLIPNWVSVVALTAVGVVIMGVLVFWKPWQPVAENPSYDEPERIENSKVHDYRFYDLLPQQQVTPIPASNHSRQTTLVEPSSESEETQLAQYVLQIRTYEQADQADARRAEILLSGLSAEVILVNDDDKIWYRVISGPYSGERNAKQAQQILKNSGIDSILVKQRKR